jgi:hypothetical protein
MHALHCRYSHLGRTNFHGYICWIKKKLRYNFSKLPNKIILMELLLQFVQHNLLHLLRKEPMKAYINDNNLKQMSNN